MADFIVSMRRFERQRRAELNWTIAMGVLSMLVGMAALVFVGLASLVASVALGWLYVMAGCAAVFVAFQLRKLGGFWSPFIFGALFVIGGFCIVSHPVLNLEILTLVIGIMMGVTGVSKIVGCFTETFESKWMLLLSGTISILCSIMIIASWPFSGLWVIGTLAGIDLIFWGGTLVAYASVAKRFLS